MLTATDRTRQAIPLSSLKNFDELVGQPAAWGRRAWEARASVCPRQHRGPSAQHLEGWLHGKVTEHVSPQFVDLETNQITLTLCLSNLRQMAGGHCVLSLASRVCSVSFGEPSGRVDGKH